MNALNVSRRQKLDWALEKFSPENVYADGERTLAEAEEWAVQMYDREFSPEAAQARVTAKRAARRILAAQGIVGVKVR
jgi:hypothetical protein